MTRRATHWSVATGDWAGWLVLFDLDGCTTELSDDAAFDGVREVAAGGLNDVAGSAARREVTGETSGFDAD